MRNQGPPDQEKKERFEDALNTLDYSLKRSKWVAGNAMTLADVAVVVSVSTAEVRSLVSVEFETIFLSIFRRCAST